MILIENDKNITLKAVAQTTFGLPVTYAGVIATGANYIGLADVDETVSAQNTDLGNYYPINSTMRVLLRSEISGKVLNMLAGGTFAAGDYVKFTTAGELIEETDGAVSTVNTVGIAMDAGADGVYSEVLML